MKAIPYFLVIAGLTLLLPAESTETLTWTASDGRVIQAKFIKLDGESVVMEKDGKQFAVAFAKLNAQSVEHAKNAARTLVAGKPEPSITDLVIPSAEWKFKSEPDYFCDVSEDSSSPTPYPRWLSGPKGTRLQFHLQVKKDTIFVAEIGRANAPADACLLLDSKEVCKLGITTKTFKGTITPAKEGPLGDVSEDLWCMVPAGDHTLTLLNSGTGWIEVPTVRFTGIGPKTFHLERRPVKTVLVHEVVKMIAPKLRSRVWGVGVGTFPSDDGQTVNDLKVRILDLEHKVSRIQDANGHDYLKLEAAAGPSHAQSITVEVLANVTLYSRRLVPGKASERPEISEADRQCYTKIYERKEMDTVEAWIKQNNLARGAEEPALAFAQRLMNVFRRKLRYKWDPSAPKGAAISVKRGWGACGDLNGLAVDVLKLSLIPARARQGRNIIGDSRALTASTDETMHVAAEFWVDEVGWVPIEASAMSGPSLTVGGPLKSYLGIAYGEHLNKHYDSFYINSTWRSFQLMDFPFGSWEGSWDGWHLESSFGYQPIVSAPVSK